MASQIAGSGSATKASSQDPSEISMKLTEEIDKLKTCFESKDVENLLFLLRELKSKHINSKLKIRSFRDVHGFKLLVSILVHYVGDYVTPNPEHSQLISLVIGILGNCCLQSNSVQSHILSRDTLKCLMSILSAGEIESTEKLWADTVKLLLVLKLYRLEHIEYLCELGLIETLLSAFSREDKKSVSSVIKLFSGLSHSPQICVRLIDTYGITILLEYLGGLEEETSIIEVLKIFRNFLNHKQDSFANNFSSNGGVYKVIELCRNDKPQIRSQAWECFLTCNYSSETRACIGNAGGIQLLLNKLSSCAPDEMPRHLLDILFACSKDPSNRQHIKHSNALQFIINVLKKVDTVKIQVQLLNIIIAYYFDEESFVFMVKRLNLVDTLTHILQQINDAIKVSSEEEVPPSGIHTPTCGSLQMNELSFLATECSAQPFTSSDIKDLVITLISRISHIKGCVIYLASTEIFRALIFYILASRDPHCRSSKILKRISTDNACFEKLLRDGNIPLCYELCLHAENLPLGHVGITKPRIENNSCPVYVPTEEYLLLDRLARAAESPFGMGVVNSMLKGSPGERTTCVLSLPYLCRTQKKRFFHDFSGTVTSLISILSNPADEEQFQQSIKVFSYFCESLHKPVPSDLPSRMCLSPSSYSHSPPSFSPPHEYAQGSWFYGPNQKLSPFKCTDDSGSELSSGAISDEDYTYDSSVKRQSKLSRAIRPEVGSIEYCPPAKRAHIDSEACLLDFSEFTSVQNTEQTDSSTICFYSNIGETDFDFEFCVDDRTFPVHAARMAASSDVLGAMIRWARSTSSGTCATLTLVPAFIFESIIHQIYNCDYSCPTISGMLWPLDQDPNTDYQHPNEIQRKHINFLTEHATSLSSSINSLLKDVFKATQDQSSIYPGYHDPSSMSSSNIFTKFLHLLALFFTTDILIMDYKTKVTTSLGRHISPNNAVVLLVLSIEFHWRLLANKICRYIFRDMSTPNRRGCFQQIMKYPQSVTDEILEIFNHMIMEMVLK